MPDFQIFANINNLFKNKIVEHSSNLKSTQNQSNQLLLEVISEHDVPVCNFTFSIATAAH